VLSQNEAVALFVQRAQSVRKEFQLMPTNAPAVADICVRLDGLPLAIELAAARSKVLAPDALLARLNSRMDLLTGGARDVPSRQRTLRNSIEWSYQLLEPAEQTLFARLGVFVGGWTLEAAEQVCKPDLNLAGEILDGLQTLVEHNLIQQQVTSDGAVRFGMLETLREYALEQLEAGGERETMCRHHADYFLALVDQGKLVLFIGIRDEDWESRIAPELDNLRAALQWSRDVPGKAEMGLRLTLALTWFSIPVESQRLCERALAQAEAEGLDTSLTRAELLKMLGLSLAWQGDYAAGETQIAASVKLFKERGERTSAAHALERWGWVAREQGHTATAIVHLQEALGLARELEDEHLSGAVTTTLAEALSMQGDTVAAKKLLEENLTRAHKLTDNEMLGWTLNHLGHVAQQEGDYDKAMQFHTQCWSIFRTWDNYDLGAAEALHCLGETGLAQGDTPFATTHLTRALVIAQESGYLIGVAWCLSGLAGAAALEERPERAAFLWGAAKHLRLRLGSREGPATHAVHERLMERAREQLGEKAFAAAVSNGSALTMEEAIAHALQGKELDPES
jgi:tetratricopeptide (TPR) repeat protein